MSRSDLTELLVAAMEMGATPDGDDMDGEGQAPHRALQTRNSAPSFSGASHGATAKEPLRITSNSYVSGTTRASSARSSRRFGPLTSPSLPWRSNGGANRVRLEGRLTVAAEKLSLHVTACRSVVEALRRLDLRRVRAQHEEAGRLRRRALKLMVRVLAARWKDGDDDGGDDGEGNDDEGNGGGNDDEKAAGNTGKQRAASESVAAGAASSSLASSGVACACPAAAAARRTTTRRKGDGAADTGRIRSWRRCCRWPRVTISRRQWSDYFRTFAAPHPYRSTWETTAGLWQWQ